MNTNNLKALIGEIDQALLDHCYSEEQWNHILRFKRRIEAGDIPTMPWMEWLKVLSGLNP